jgi:hypothetical protein
MFLGCNLSSALPQTTFAQSTIAIFPISLIKPLETPTSAQGLPAASGRESLGPPSPPPSPPSSRPPVSSGAAPSNTAPRARAAPLELLEREQTVSTTKLLKKHLKPVEDGEAMQEHEDVFLACMNAEINKVGSVGAFAPVLACSSLLPRWPKPPPSPGGLSPYVRLSPGRLPPLPRVASPRVRAARARDLHAAVRWKCVRTRVDSAEEPWRSRAG